MEALALRRGFCTKSLHTGLADATSATLASPVLQDKDADFNNILLEFKSKD